jgi:hypothetical protein
MGHADEMRRCLAQCDVKAARRLWHHLAPNAPAPDSDEEALSVIHYARTRSRSINLRLRVYSHFWLLDHDLPSGLPDNLKAKADRIYPRVVNATGIAVLSQWPEVSKLIRGAMEDEVMNAAAHKEIDPQIVQRRML